MIPEKNLIIFKKSDDSYNVTLYLRNRELCFDCYKDVFIGEEIAFGSWWEYSNHDAKMIFDLLKLNDYVTKAPIDKLARFKFDNADVDWTAISKLKSFS